MSAHSPIPTQRSGGSKGLFRRRLIAWATRGRGIQTTPPATTGGQAAPSSAPAAPVVVDENIRSKTLEAEFRRQKREPTATFRPNASRKQINDALEAQLGTRKGLALRGPGALGAAGNLLGGLQETTEVVAGLGTVGVQQLIPGEQEIEKKFKQSISQGVNPIDAAFKAYTESDLPFGVKFAIELGADSLNLLGNS